MTLDEAIKIKEKYQYLLQDASIPEVLEADKLGSEALKVVRGWRKLHPSVGQPLLPGETTDEPTALEQSLKRGNQILALGRKMIKETDELLGKPTSSP